MRVKNERWGGRRNAAKDLQCLRGPAKLTLAPKVRTRNPHESDTTVYIHYIHAPTVCMTLLDVIALPIDTTGNCITNSELLGDGVVCVCVVYITAHMFMWIVCVCVCEDKRDNVCLSTNKSEWVTERQRWRERERGKSQMVIMKQITHPISRRQESQLDGFPASRFIAAYWGEAERRKSGQLRGSDKFMCH